MSRRGVTSTMAPRMINPVRICSGDSYDHLIVLAHWVRWGVALASGIFVVALWIGPALATPPQPDRPPTHVAFDIMPVRPGGPPEGYAAYLATTALRVPAHSLITVTIRNFDLDPTPLPVGSPYATVEGTIGQVAFADSRAYFALDNAVIAHTFTVPRLGINVPIPGRSSSGEHMVMVTFSFRTAGSATYLWQCFDPCGNGPGGLDGPMADVDYMRGTLTVVP